MLHQPISQRPQAGRIDPALEGRVDHSMDILQYATAFFALIVAALLAVLR
jgi:hypothetical protein